MESGELSRWSSRPASCSPRVQGAARQRGRLQRGPRQRLRADARPPRRADARPPRRARVRGTSAGVSAAGSAATSPASASAASAGRIGDRVDPSRLGDQSQPATAVVPAGPVRRLLRRHGTGLLPGREHRPRHHQRERDDRPAERADQASTGPEFIIAWVPKVLQAREVAGAEQLVDIAQIFQRSGTLAVSWKSSDITKPKDFKGKKIGVWDFGNEFEVTAGAKKAGLEQGKTTPNTSRTST